MTKKKQKTIEQYEEEERVAQYPTSMAHDRRFCGVEPEWEYQFESREMHYWLCLGCGYELVTDIKGKELARDERL